jgi:calcium-dependent protein kinase
LCTGGELFDKISSSGKLSEAYTRNLFVSIAKAINYCHSHKICHRDLKPENFILLDTTENSPIKIIDFGLSVNLKGQALTLKAGSAYYMSPEVLDGNYNELCDVWSLGVILYIMLSGIPPFYGKNDQ